MEFPGLITIDPDQTDLVDAAARIIGVSFLEEGWTSTYLAALGGDEALARKREVSRAMIREEVVESAPYGCAFILPDQAGAAMGLLGSEIAAAGTTWPAIEDEAHARVIQMLTSDEQAKLDARATQMEPISYFGWGSEVAADMGYGDYIYFAAWAVDASKRGSGAFRRLTSPFFDYADQQGIPVFLECYADRLVSLYEHVGFEVFRVFEDPAFDVKQVCMVRHPKGGKVS